MRLIDAQKIHHLFRPQMCYLGVSMVLVRASSDPSLLCWVTENSNKIFMFLKLNKAAGYQANLGRISAQRKLKTFSPN